LKNFESRTVKTYMIWWRSRKEERQNWHPKSKPISLRLQHKLLIVAKVALQPPIQIYCWKFFSAKLCVSPLSKYNLEIWDNFQAAWPSK